MTPKELLENLESLGWIDAKLLKKIRSQVDDPDRTVKTTAVLKYLVRKEQLTEDQAKQMLRGEMPVLASHNTDELMAGVGEEPAAVDPVEEVAMAIDEVVEYEELEPVEELETIEEYVEPAPMAIDDAAAYGNVDAGFGVGEFGEPAAAAPQSNAKPTFGGKIDRSDQWNSKWPYIGFGLLGFLLIVGMFLWFTVNNMEPEAMFQHARDSTSRGLINRRSMPSMITSKRRPVTSSSKKPKPAACKAFLLPRLRPNSGRRLSFVLGLDWLSMPKTKTSTWKRSVMTWV